ncbi:hypothetical protein LX69_01744 [Breznakibacter xylanolyticus]|uniref:Uncharacterized protein n=1 Tax=Breznakibacter xylanolyticus TaxID=990 RepID=A0A2W7NIZ4_9BACT|nr:DUF3413 domain-containing protein [Breznakibacter xylanolyticus]PZX16674.1 hypothetical protein LX69_01744 [Breznakibacter xylanolyticus]
MSQRIDIIKQGAWFFLFNTLILLLSGYKYFQYFADCKSTITFIYLTVTTLSHFAAISFIPYLLIFVPVTLLYPKKSVLWVIAGILTTVTSLFLLIDSMVYNLYRFHINRFVLELIFGGNGNQIFEFQYYQYIVSIIGGLIFISTMLWASYNFFNWSKSLSLLGGKLITITLLIFMLMSHFIHMWADATNHFSITRSSRTYPLYFPTTGKRLIASLGLSNSTTDNTSSNLSFDDESNGLNYPQHPIMIDSTANTNIVLILVDSWNPCTFDSITMPNIYHFSKECEVYHQHYSGSNGTRTGLFSLFYGIPGLYWDAILSTQTSPVLVNILQKNHYQIETYTSASLTNPPFDRTIFSKVKGLQLKTEGESATIRDSIITMQWLNKHQSKSDFKNPLFSFLFYDGLHAISHPKSFKGPYQPEWEYAKYEILNNDIDPTPFLNLYKNSANYIDYLIGKILQQLKDNGCLENSWVIISGDHGQEFNENKKNYWGHNGNYSPAQMQVPLMIHKPLGKNRNYHHWSSHYDLVPSLMNDIFKCQNPISDYSMGKCLNDSSKREWMLVGSNDNYAILEPNRITSIYFNGTFDITDSHLNEIQDGQINTQLFNKILLKSKMFYKQ